MRENHLEEVMVPSGTRRQPKPKDLARSMFPLRNSHSLLQNKVEQGVSLIIIIPIWGSQAHVEKGNLVSCLPGIAEIAEWGYQSFLS